MLSKTQLITLSNRRIKGSRGRNLPSQRRIRVELPEPSTNSPTESCQGLQRGSRLHFVQNLHGPSFNAIKNQDWVRRLTPLPLTRKGQEPKNIALSMMKWDIVPLIAALSRIAPGAGKQRVSQGVYSQPRTALRDQSIGGESDSVSRESGQPGSPPVSRNKYHLRCFPHRRQYTLVNQDGKTLEKQ